MRYLGRRYNQEILLPKPVYTNWRAEPTGPVTAAVFVLFFICAFAAIPALVILGKTIGSKVLQHHGVKVGILIGVVACWLVRHRKFYRRHGERILAMVSLFAPAILIGINVTVLVNSYAGPDVEQTLDGEVAYVFKWKKRYPKACFEVQGVGVVHFYLKTREYRNAFHDGDKVKINARPGFLGFPIVKSIESETGTTLKAE